MQSYKYFGDMLRAENEAGPPQPKDARYRVLTLKTLWATYDSPFACMVR